MSSEHSVTVASLVRTFLRDLKQVLCEPPSNRELCHDNRELMSRSERRPNLGFAMPLRTQVKPQGAQVQVLCAVLIRYDSKFSPLKLLFVSVAFFRPHLPAGISEC